MGFRNPFRITGRQERRRLRHRLLARLADSADSAGRRARAGSRSCASRRTTAGRSATRPTCRTTSGTSTPRRRCPSAAAPETARMRQPDPRTAEHSRWVASGGPAVEPGLEFGPPITQPEIWYSYRDNQAPRTARTARRASPSTGRARRPTRSGCARSSSRSCSPAASGPHGAAPYDYDPDNPSTTKFPPYYDGAFIFGEFTQRHPARGPARLAEPRLQDQQLLNCGAVRRRDADAAVPVRQPDGHGVRARRHFYLLTYGDGFFAINPDAGDVALGLRQGPAGPGGRAVGATPTDGPAPLTVGFSSAGSSDRGPRRLDPVRVGLRRQRHGRLDRSEPDVHLHDDGQLHRQADGHRLERQGRVGEHDDHGRQHVADRHGRRAGGRRDVRLRRQHPVHGHGHRPRGRRDRLRPRSR